MVPGDQSAGALPGGDFRYKCGGQCLVLSRHARSAHEGLVVWKTVPGKYKTALNDFLQRGGPVPAGAKTVGRWHTPGSTLGWHLIEADDLGLVAEHVAEWADVIEIDA